MGLFTNLFPGLLNFLKILKVLGTYKCCIENVWNRCFAQWYTCLIILHMPGKNSENNSEFLYSKSSKGTSILLTWV